MPLSKEGVLALSLTLGLLSTIAAALAVWLLWRAKKGNQSLVADEEEQQPACGM